MGSKTKLGMAQKVSKKNSEKTQKSHKNQIRILSESLLPEYIFNRQLNRKKKQITTKLIFYLKKHVQF